MTGRIVSDEKYLSPYEVGRTSVIRSLLPHRGESRCALDLACGSGFFTKLLAEQGWEVTAIDVEKENVAAARRFTDRAMVGEAPSVLRELRDNSFDLILTLELIEHMADADAKLTLKELNRLTKRDGRLIASTPNRLSLEGLGGYYWGERIRRWARWTAWDSTHVKIYTSFEFLRLLKKTGWAVEKSLGYWFVGRLPLGIRVSLPFASASWIPFNRFGFNTIVLCHPRPPTKHA